MEDHHFGAPDAEALRLESGQDRPDELPGHGIGLEDDEGCLAGHRGGRKAEGRSKVNAAMGRGLGPCIQASGIRGAVTDLGRLWTFRDP